MQELATDQELLVRQMRQESDSVLSLSLERSDGGDLPPWTAGSHIDLHLPNGLVRQYSLCGDPRDARHWRLGVLREPASRGASRYICDDLRPGALVAASAPRNNFGLVDGPFRCFIAGGIGITPILPMIRAVEESGAAWSLCYGGRRRSSMAFLGELTGYGDRVRVLPEDEVGRLDIPRLLADIPTGAAVYCCGPEGLLAAVESAMQQRPDLSLHIERFAARPVRPEDGSGSESFRVQLQRSGLSFDVPEGRSILDLLEDAQVFVPSACREGVCGSCETAVLSGAVDHRDSVLSPAEQATNSTMLVCVSRAVSDELVLDL
ncbi:PDR/VanB family oxidoreductase [Streptomyces sp. NPDC057580]|uniref:PDR/VanB family oxidoreductase n=1 Tax=Streptomyces sp. NPDC057580 TaxID=3346173 RepID=UPI0036D08C22